MLSGKLRWGGSRRGTAGSEIVRPKLNALNLLNLWSEHTHTREQRE
jgi:hypothetical protein